MAGRPRGECQAHAVRHAWSITAPLHCLSAFGAFVSMEAR